MLRILAVSMLDYKIGGSDPFFIQVSDNKEKAVVIYRAYMDGQVTVVRPPAPLSSVAPWKNSTPFTMLKTRLSYKT